MNKFLDRLWVPKTRNEDSITKSIWIGGTKGAENNWHHPENWHNFQVPNWNSLVIISAKMYNMGHFPIIEDQLAEIAGLVIEENARLMINSSAHLIVDGMFTQTIGIHTKGTFVNRGNLHIVNTTNECIHLSGLFINEGKIVIDKPFEEGILNWNEESWLSSGTLECAIS